MMTLILTFLTTGLVTSKEFRPIVDVTISKTDFARCVQEMRDLLYCMYDENYFEQADGGCNQILT